MLKVTFDTNCFFDYYERNIRRIHIQALIDLQSQGHIEIAMTTRVRVDTDDKWEGLGSSPIWAKIQSFPILETLGSAFRIGVSRIGSEDFVTSKKDGKTLKKLREIMRAAQLQDVDHLFGHIKANRDIFTTSDGHFLNHKDVLGKDFGVIILNPEDTVKRIRELVST